MTKFDDLMREIDPYLAQKQSASLDKRSAEDLELIITGQWRSEMPRETESDNVVTFRPTSTTRRSLIKWSLAAAAVVALTVGTSISGVLDGGRGNEAVAISLPALVVVPTNESKSMVVNSLRRSALNTDDAPGYDPQQFSLYEIGEVSIDGNPGTIGPVAKTHVVVKKDDRGTLMMTATTEGAFGSDGRMIEYRSSNGALIKPGTTKTTPYIGPQFAQPTGQDSDALKKFIREFQMQATALINEKKSLAINEVIGSTLAEWNFSQKQSASLLDLIGQTSDIEYSGQIKDRMGRIGHAFSSVVPDEYSGSTRHSLVFDAATGKLNAYEEVYLKGEEFPGGSTRSSITISEP